MNSDIFIIVHGASHFDYTKKCIDGFARYNPNVIWSDFTDMSDDIKAYLDSKGMKYVISPRPNEQGMSKLAWQRDSFLNGLHAARLNGAEYVYKVRTDLDIPHLDYILDELRFKAENGGKKINVLCWDEWSSGICDWCWFSDINTAEEYWSFVNINIPSERGILPQYFQKKNIPYNYTYNSAIQLIDTHIDLYLKLGIPINWLKNTLEDEHPLTDHMSNCAIYK